MAQGLANRCPPSHHRELQSNQLSQSMSGGSPVDRQTEGVLTTGQALSEAPPQNTGAPRGPLADQWSDALFVQVESACLRSYPKLGPELGLRALSTLAAWGSTSPANAGAWPASEVWWLCGVPSLKGTPETLWHSEFRRASSLDLAGLH